MKKFIALFLLVSVSLFASPAWYKTQIGTGIGNCGPASAAMAVMWSIGTDISVQTARKIIGNPAPYGATGFEDLDAVLAKYKVPYNDTTIKTVADIKWLLSWNIVIVVIDASKIKEKNYEYNYYHFVVLSGLEDDHFIVQDPWGGPDQSYNTEEVWAAMPYKEIIAVSHPPDYWASHNDK
jgi:hypothetical protein